MEEVFIRLIHFYLPLSPKPLYIVLCPIAPPLHSHQNHQWLLFLLSLLLLLLLEIGSLIGQADLELV